MYFFSFSKYILFLVFFYIYLLLLLFLLLLLLLLLLFYSLCCWTARIKNHLDSAAHEIEPNSRDVVFSSTEDRTLSIRTDALSRNKYGKFETDARRDTFFNQHSSASGTLHYLYITIYQNVIFCVM